MEISTTNAAGAGTNRLKIGFAIEPDSMIKDLDDLKRKLEEIDKLIDDIHSKKDITISVGKTAAGGPAAGTATDDADPADIARMFAQKFVEWKRMTASKLSKGLFKKGKGGLSLYDLVMKRYMEADVPNEYKYVAMYKWKKFGELVQTRAASSLADEPFGLLSREDELLQSLRFLLTQGKRGALPLASLSTDVSKAMMGMSLKFPELSREAEKGHVAAIRKDVPKRFPGHTFEIIKQFPVPDVENPGTYRADYGVMVYDKKGKLVAILGYESKRMATTRDVAQAWDYQYPTPEEKTEQLLKTSKGWKKGSRERKAVERHTKEELVAAYGKYRSILMSGVPVETEQMKAIMEKLNIEMIESPPIVEMKGMIGELKEAVKQLLHAQKKSDKEIKTALDALGLSVESLGTSTKEEIEM
ncbi:MAG: hypothetical protein ACTSQ8_09290 [Candidatus Helarchaeota archaeon]